MRASIYLIALLALIISAPEAFARGHGGGHYYSCGGSYHTSHNVGPHSGYGRHK
jgi:hypothetical protein